MSKFFLLVVFHLTVEIDAYNIEANCCHHKQKQHSYGSHCKTEVLVHTAFPTFAEMVEEQVPGYDEYDKGRGERTKKGHYYLSSLDWYDAQDGVYAQQYQHYDKLISTSNLSRICQLDFNLAFVDKVAKWTVFYGKVSLNAHRFFFMSPFLVKHSCLLIGNQT